MKKIEEQKFIEICKSASSMAVACSILKMNFSTFKRYAVKFNCYFPNQGGKGTKKGNQRKYGYPIQDVIDGKHPQMGSYKVKRKLIAAKLLENKCSICGIMSWNDKPISLELDHIDGNSHNHKLDNLRILCPNCHSQTDTFRFKRRK